MHELGIIIITKDFLVELGYSLSESVKIIRLTKEKLVNEGYDYYKGRKVGRVPIKAVEAVLGYELTGIYKHDKINEVQKNMIDKAELDFKEAL